MEMIDFLPPTVLVIEDSNEDYTALRRAFRRVNEQVQLFRCETGEDALDMLVRQGSCAQRSDVPKPSLVLLDLNLPATNGHEVLRQIKANPTLRKLPVVVLTTSSNPKDIEYSYQDGASGYLVKTVDFDIFTQTVHSLDLYWFKTVILPDGAEVES